MSEKVGELLIARLAVSHRWKIISDNSIDSEVIEESESENDKDQDAESEADSEA